MVHADFTVEDEVARITLTRPEALNAIDTPTKERITETLREYDDDETVRVVVFSGEGDAFCAGGDVREIPEVKYSLEYFTETWQELFDVMQSIRQPTVVAVDGYALGGGFDWMLHADVAIAAHDAQLGQPEVSLGIVNHFAPPILRETVGRQKAMDMMLTGETISGKRAGDLGLVARSVPGDELEAEVQSVAESLREKSPRVLGKLKRGIYESQDMAPGAARDHLETIALESARNDPDYREGVDAQLEDRDPEWED